MVLVEVEGMRVTMDGVDGISHFTFRKRRVVKGEESWPGRAWYRRG